ncbi:hypothetical protein Cgig2_003002 [Carnegiea gigantea]|uniref:Uncharacterized protein n=1 Tax=Carnegiea gigantea TaxID=171969 RepID=A0A9Q1GJS0_9CARY|nr:hypothetical protein Cgig2_003002 [Carnegiea gigantea]
MEATHIVIDSNDVVQTGSELGDFFGIFMDARGQASGLALLWDKLVTINLLSCSLHHIDVSMTLEGDASTWRFSEKGGPPKAQSDIDTFRASFIDNGLYDLGFSSYDFTWCNFQENGIVIEERLDRFCADTECFSHRFRHLRSSSYSSEVSSRIDEKSAQKRRFMFENMWFTEPPCEDVVAAAWSSTSHANAMDNLLSHLSKCSNELDHWNRSSFRNVNQQIRDLEQRLNVMLLVAVKQVSHP